MNTDMDMEPYACCVCVCFGFKEAIIKKLEKVCLVWDGGHHRALVRLNSPMLKSTAGAVL